MSNQNQPNNSLIKEESLSQEISLSPPPPGARLIGSHSYQCWVLNDVIETSHYNGDLPDELRGALPRIIGDIATLPIEKRQIYEQAARRFNVTLEDLYSIYVVGPWEELFGPKRMGRPPRMSAVTEYIAQAAIAAQEVHQVAWSLLFDILVDELTAKNDTRKTGQDALSKLLNIQKKMTKTRAGSFLKQTVDRYKTKIQKK